MKTEQFKAEASEWEQRFKDHRASLHSSISVTVIEWRKPGTVIDSVTYILRSNRLYVGGDLGEFVFCWSEVITPEFLSTCDWGYFKGKCQASEHGRQPVQWCHATAEQWFKDQSTEDMSEAVRDLMAEASDHGFDRYEIERIAREVNDESGDSELASEIATCGLRTAFRFVAIYTGLQMAIAQTKAGKGLVV